MEDNSGYLIRPACKSDISSLVSFFRKAYGEETVFQDPGFINYYFNSFTNSIEPLSANLVGVDSEGEIISHYGGLHYFLDLDGVEVSGYWGVNAYTLPEWRGKGLNSKMVKSIAASNDFNAVIGMPYEAPFFYQKYNYNIFDKETLSRFIYAIREETFQTVDFLGNNVERAKELIGIKDRGNSLITSTGLIDLNHENYFAYDFELKAPVKAATFRSKDFLAWRIFNNPYINYKVVGISRQNRIVSYIVIREEILKPQNFSVLRIIDLFGSVDLIEPLLEYTVSYAREVGRIYIDFSVFGNLYDEILLKTGFDKLVDNDCCLLPQVSAPVENRPNHEFIVLQSTKYDKQIRSLTKESVYFTRIDGDRDRIARLNQLNR